MYSNIIYPLSQFLVYVDIKPPPTIYSVAKSSTIDYKNNRMIYSILAVVSRTQECVVGLAG